jgi:hypothetical protein
MNCSGHERATAGRGLDGTAGSRAAGKGSTAAGKSSRAAGERGSVLVLVPAGFLVLILLGAMAVDAAVAFLGQRQLADTTAGAANDAATAALANAAFYGSGNLAVDPSAAAAVVCRSFLAQGNGELHDVTLFIAVDGPVIRVRAHAQVDAVFGRIVPGFGRRAVSAEATAAATTGADASRAVPADFLPVPCT